MISASDPEPEIVISDDDDENLPIKELLEKKMLDGYKKLPKVNGETCEIVSDESLSAEDIVVIPSNSKTDKSKTNSNGHWWKTPVKGKITTCNSQFLSLRWKYPLADISINGMFAL